MNNSQNDSDLNLEEKNKDFATRKLVSYQDTVELDNWLEKPPPVYTFTPLTSVKKSRKRNKKKKTSHDYELVDENEDDSQFVTQDDDDIEDDSELSYLPSLTCFNKFSNDSFEMDSYNEIAWEDSREEGNEDYDSDQGTFQSHALPVSTHISNEKLGPMTGEEYLLAVRREAMSLPSIVEASSETSRSRILFRPILSYLHHSDDSSQLKQPIQMTNQQELVFKSFNFDEEKSKVTLENFHALKEALYLFIPNDDQTNQVVELENQIPFSSSAIIPFPETMEAKLWHDWFFRSNSIEFDIIGEQMLKKELYPLNTKSDFSSITSAEEKRNELLNDEKIFLTTLEKSLEPHACGDFSSSKARWMLSEQLLGPFDTLEDLSQSLSHLPYLLMMDQSLTISLLKLHGSWLKASSINQNQSEWIYQLLVRLDPLLTADQIFILRNLCRRCLLIRNHLLSEITSEQLSSSSDLTKQALTFRPLDAVSEIIFIISFYFGQKDLLLEI